MVKRPGRWYPRLSSALGDGVGGEVEKVRSFCSSVETLSFVRLTAVLLDSGWPLMVVDEAMSHGLTRACMTGGCMGRSGLQTESERKSLSSALVSRQKHTILLCAALNRNKVKYAFRPTKRAVNYKMSNSRRCGQNSLTHIL